MQQNHGTNTKKVESFCFPDLKSIVNCKDYDMFIKLTFSKSVENLRPKSNNLVENNNIVMSVCTFTVLLFITSPKQRLILLNNRNTLRKMKE